MHRSRVLQGVTQKVIHSAARSTFSQIWCMPSGGTVSILGIRHFFVEANSPVHRLTAELHRVRIHLTKHHEPILSLRLKNLRMQVHTRVNQAALLKKTYLLRRHRLRRLLQTRSRHLQRHCHQSGRVMSNKIVEQVSPCPSKAPLAAAGGTPKVPPSKAPPECAAKTQGAKQAAKAVTGNASRASSSNPWAKLDKDKDCPVKAPPPGATPITPPRDSTPPPYKYPPGKAPKDTASGSDLTVKSLPNLPREARRHPSGRHQGSMTMRAIQRGAQEYQLVTLFTNPLRIKDLRTAQSMIVTATSET